GVDQLDGRVRDGAQHVLDIERGGDLAADALECAEFGALATATSVREAVSAAGFDADRELRRDRLKKRSLFGVELMTVDEQYIEDADEAVSAVHDHRDRNLRGVDRVTHRGRGEIGVMFPSVGRGDGLTKL